jgi:hypothetical protein
MIFTEFRGISVECVEAALWTFVNGAPLALDVHHVVRLMLDAESRSFAFDSKGWPNIA